MTELDMAAFRMLSRRRIPLELVRAFNETARELRLEGVALDRWADDGGTARDPAVVERHEFALAAAASMLVAPRDIR